MTVLCASSACLSNVLFVDKLLHQQKKAASVGAWTEMPKVKVKSDTILVVLESVLTGHRAFWCRKRLDPKLEKFLYDPRLDRSVLFKEVEKRGGKNLPPAVKKFYGF